MKKCYSSRLEALKELVEKYQKIFLESASSNGFIPCYTKDRLAIQWPAQQPLQATTTLEDKLCSRPPRNHYKGQPVNYKRVAL